MRGQCRCAQRLPIGLIPRRGSVRSLVTISDEHPRAISCTLKLSIRIVRIERTIDEDLERHLDRDHALSRAGMSRAPQYLEDPASSRAAWNATGAFIEATPIIRR
jgi:hypothetical protein